jgi:hypothetical protein
MPALDCRGDQQLGKTNDGCMSVPWPQAHFFLIHVLFTLVMPFYTADSRMGPYDEEMMGRLMIAREG